MAAQKIGEPGRVGGSWLAAAHAAEAGGVLARQAKERGWWQSYASAIPEYFQAYLGLEAEASLIREYAAELVPGLLQTADYGSAFLHAPPAPAGEEELARRVTVRLARQERLTGQDPPEYWAVLNEAVIRCPVGGPAVMREQLGRLAELANLPQVNIQVLPFAAGAPPWPSLAALGPHSSPS